MRQLNGLEKFLSTHSGFIKAEQVAQYIQAQFSNSHLLVYAEPLNEQQTLLADLTLNGELASYEPYAQRLEFIYTGYVDSCLIPLSYTINGVDLSFCGRCSVLPKVCGVDLYFSNYTRQEGFFARQKITISIKELVKQLKVINKNN